jgi:uncharacterized caspase-like protein
MRDRAGASDSTHPHVGDPRYKAEPSVEGSGWTLVAFAAKQGQTAADGSGANSPFVSAMLQHIGEPGVDVNIFFRKVRDSVLSATANRQEPFVYGSLPGEALSFQPTN